jgi:glutamyl/glutaminyl-tRNA synthetase
LFKKTRIAPTPSGYLHLGNVYSFALTDALAKQTGAKILLRIDDLDRDRVLPEYVEDIFDTLRFLDIPWNEGPQNSLEFEERYSQRHRLALYRRALGELEASGSLFACVCSRTQLSRTPCTCKDKGLPLNTRDAAWRLDTSIPRQLKVKVWPAGATVAGATDAAALSPDPATGTTLPADMQDFVVRKKDGFPAYQLTSVLDDLHYGIDLIVRGADLWPSTLAQLYLSAVLPPDVLPADMLPRVAFGQIHFHHHSLLSGPEGEKLSKSAGATSVHYLRRQGKTPSDIYTWIAKVLGHARERPGTWQELIALAT